MKMSLLMAKVPIIDLLIASFTITVIIRGFWGTLYELLLFTFPILTILIVIQICVAIFLRALPPSPEAVEAVLGVEPHLHVEDGQYVMKSVAHRGCGLDAPENSLAAFQQCHEKKCDAIEFDVTLTADDVPIVFHDDTLERLTDLNLKIHDLKYSDLANIDISVKHCFRDRFANTNIPTLDQTVTQLLASGQRMFIDIKDNNVKFVKIINDLFEKYPALYGQAVVSSFNPILLYYIRRSNPKIICSMAYRPHAFAYDSYNYPEGVGNRRAQDDWLKHYFLCVCDFLHGWALMRFTYSFVGLSAILLHTESVSGHAIMQWRKRGIRVIAWSANTPAEKQYFARVLKITYLTDTLTGEATTHSTSFSSSL